MLKFVKNPATIVESESTPTPVPVAIENRDVVQ